MEKVELSAFRYTSYAQEILFGPGCLSQLKAAVDRFGWHRLMLCTSRSMRAGGQAAAVEAALGDHLHLVFEGVQPHVQDTQVAEALALAIDRRVEAVVGLGGGSPIGLAKAAAMAIEEKMLAHPILLAAPTEQPLVPVVAIPTTYAGSEMTPLYGITHHEPEGGGPPRKVTVNHPKIIPKLVIYDPELTLDLPTEMTASTGINALAHCIEALYSVNRHPLSTAAALSGIRFISRSLLVCCHEGKNLEARTEMLMGAHLAGLSIASVTLGLHHGVCHVLGGSASVPHGIANSIMLPHVVRFNSDTTASLLIPAAEAMGLPVASLDPAAAVEALARAISNLSFEMGLPMRLRDVGVKETDLDRLAQLCFQNRTVQNNPKPVRDAAQLLAFLREAW